MSKQAAANDRGVGHSSEITIDEESKKPAKEILVVVDEGLFVHETGDTYEGFFEAKKKDRVLKMSGPGVYTTNEGDVYSGVWEADKLVGEDSSITYTDGSIYVGNIKDFCYNGRGKYIYPDGSTLTCDFVDNSPVKDMILTDPNGHIWLGNALQGYGWVSPFNHFYI